MFLMAHGLSPGGEINTGKRLKPQAFFHNLLSSSSFALEWPCRACTADSNSKLNPPGSQGILEPRNTRMSTHMGPMDKMGLVSIHAVFMHIFGVSRRKRVMEMPKKIFWGGG